MKSSFSRFLAAGFLVASTVAGLALTFAGMGCSQATPLCRTGTGSYTVKYTLRSGTGACTQLKGDVLQVNSYNAIGDDGKPALEQTSAALSPVSLLTLLDEAHERLGLSRDEEVDGDPSHRYVAAGRFATEEAQGDFCDVPNPNPVIQHIPALAAASSEKPAKPATVLSYEFSNWHIYFTPAHAGTQFRVHLKYTVDGSTCEYDGRAALFARTSCDFGDGVTPVPLACDVAPHPEIKLEDGTQLLTGSGVDPEYPVECDTETLLCVLQHDPPALK